MRYPLAFGLAPLLLASGLALAKPADNVGKPLPSVPASAGPAIAAPGIAAPWWDGLDAGVAAAAATKLAQAPTLTTRGSKESRIFRQVSPSVVMVLAGDGVGSGSVISADGRILTNWHVVQGFSEVGVVFKPKDEGARPSEADIIRADVVAVDELSDLALLKVTQRQSKLKPIKLGDVGEIQVGADVHAIGHPTGEGWTYTKGFISQFRRDYEWSAGEGVMHKADVIQTQTPINPGNSGGPLVSDAGDLIGVNSFQVANSQGLNYAVSVSDVKRFLASAGSSAAKSKPKPAPCEPKVVAKGRSEDGTGSVRAFDLTCDGKPDAAEYDPDDKKQGIELWFDKNHDDEIDIVIVDYDRDGRWDESFWDTDFDGKFDLVGHHPDGDLEPSSYSKYEG